MTAVAKVGARYQNLKSRSVSCYLIDHDYLSLFFQEKVALDPALKAAAEHDNYMLSLRILLNCLAFEYANCPLPLNHPYYYREGRLGKIQQLIERLRQAYPMQASALASVKGAIDVLLECDDNPLLENFESNVGFEDATLVLINPDYTHAVSEMCENYGIKVNINVPGAAHINATTKGVFCGCAKYFPQHVFWAPEYPELHLIRYAWFQDYIKPFRTPHGQLTAPKAPEQAVRFKPPAVYEEPESVDEMPAAEFDLGLLEQYANNMSSQRSAETIEAKVIVLKGGKFVFLPAEDSYTHHCLVNLDSDPAPKKLPVTAFDENTAILLKERRDAGDGDYVVEVANQILRDKASYYRGQQQKWKAVLREKFNAHGVSDVSVALKLAGCAIANYPNLRNWMSPRTIRPESDNDFTALLNYLGLGAEAKEMLRSMDVIRRAHIKAGHRISAQLETLVSSDDNLKSILTDGYRVYRLGEIGGKLGVYVFDRILDKTLTVPYAEAGELKRIEALYG